LSGRRNCSTLNSGFWNSKTVRAGYSFRVKNRLNLSLDHHYLTITLLGSISIDPITSNDNDRSPSKE
jgi:hypothetical protein